MSLRIISAFPGTGKSHYAKEHGCHDSDSSSFSWSSPGVRNPDFPNNYIEHIKTLEGTVFVSSHVEVRDALRNEGLYYTLVFPDPSCKDEYLERYKQRGSPQAFIDLIDKNWLPWLEALYNDKGAHKIWILEEGEYMSDVPGVDEMD